MDQRAGVGSTVVIKGELSAHEDVVIAGRVEGLINVAGHIVVVEPGAHVVGDITAKGIVVAGAVTGSLLAEERIQIASGATLDGDLAAPRIAMTDGAVVNGRVETVTETSSVRKLMKVAS
jgi:cytoskeletal protein CcmA (bactofilin family)